MPLFIKEKPEVIASTEELLSENRKAKKKQFMTMSGKRFVIYPNVFSPEIFSDTKFFLETLSISRNCDFLEIGPGSGMISVFAALRGAHKVVAIDINPDAVSNTRANAARHGVEDKMCVFQGDVFSPLGEHDTFDTIFWNVPFSHVEKEDLTMLERAVYDPGYQGLDTYLAEGRKFLKKGGELFVGFSTSCGHADVFVSLARKHGWSLQLLAETTIIETSTITSHLELYKAVLI